MRTLAMISLSEMKEPAYGARVNYTEKKARGYQVRHHSMTDKAPWTA
jgi:hypothetical protein